MKHLCIIASVILATSFVAMAQESKAPQPRSNYNHLKVLEPYLGRWVYEGPVKQTIPGFLEKGAPMRAEMAYRWAVNKNAIVLNISIQSKGAKDFEILEMIGWDVRRQTIVSGAFNSTGGMSYAQWRVDENRLVTSTRDLAGDGKESSSKIIQELKDKDTVAWSETQRIVAGEERSDSPIYEFKRVEKMK